MKTLLTLLLVLLLSIHFFSCGTGRGFGTGQQQMSLSDSLHRMKRIDSFLFVNRFAQRFRVIKAENYFHQPFFLNTLADTFPGRTAAAVTSGKYTDCYGRELLADNADLRRLLEIFLDPQLPSPLDLHPYDQKDFDALVQSDISPGGLFRLRYDSSGQLCPFTLYDLQLDADSGLERIAETSYGDMIWEHQYEILDNCAGQLLPVKTLHTTSRNWLPDSVQSNARSKIFWLKEYRWGTCYSCVSRSGYRLTGGKIARVVRAVPVAANVCSLGPMFGNDPGELDIASGLEQADTGRVHFRIYFTAKRYAGNAEGCEVLNDSTLLLRMHWNSDSLEYLPEAGTPKAFCYSDKDFEPASLMPYYHQKLLASGAYQRRHWETCKSFGLGR